MDKKVFLDTNIILDLLDKKRAKHQIAKNLISYLTLNGYQIVISEDMLSTIYYIDKDREKILLFFKTILRKWEIVSYGVTLIEEAIDISITKSIDLEDLMQCLSAKKSHCDILITEDKDFYNCGLTLYTMDDFLATYRL
jgi:predicted nucleic acid-binding protein